VQVKLRAKEDETTIVHQLQEELNNLLQNLQHNQQAAGQQPAEETNPAGSTSESTIQKVNSTILQKHFDPANENDFITNRINNTNTPFNTTTETSIGSSSTFPVSMEIDTSYNARNFTTPTSPTSGFTYTQLSRPTSPLSGFTNLQLSPPTSPPRACANTISRCTSPTNHEYMNANTTATANSRCTSPTHHEYMSSDSDGDIVDLCAGGSSIKRRKMPSSPQMIAGGSIKTDLPQKVQPPTTSGTSHSSKTWWMVHGIYHTALRQSLRDREDKTEKTVQPNDILPMETNPFQQIQPGNTLPNSNEYLQSSSNPPIVERRGRPRKDRHKTPNVNSNTNKNKTAANSVPGDWASSFGFKMKNTLNNITTNNPITTFATGITNIIDLKTKPFSKSCPNLPTTKQ